METDAGVECIALGQMGFNIVIKSGLYWAEVLRSEDGPLWRSPEAGCTRDELHRALCELGMHPRDVGDAIHDAERRHFQDWPYSG